MTYVLALVIGLAVGAIAGRRLLQRVFPTTQEKIDAVMRLSTPATADDLVRLMASRMVAGAGNVFYLHAKVGLTDIRTPKREHLALILPDIAGFEAMVLAAKGALDASTDGAK